MPTLLVNKCHDLFKAPMPTKLGLHCLLCRGHPPVAQFHTLDKGHRILEDLRLTAIALTIHAESCCEAVKFTLVHHPDIGSWRQQPQSRRL